MDTIQTQEWIYTHNDSTPSLGSTSTISSISSSNCTTTTSSTVPGLGEISGKAILALGKLTLRGAEHIIIRRRLDVISTHFPHRDTARILGIDQMYEDILELSRRDLYHNTVRIRALAIILAQIGSHQTTKLLEHLLKWPFVEIKLFISELTAMLDPLQLHSAREAEKVSSPVQAYRKSLATWESHSLDPFVIFLQHLEDRGHSTSWAILDGGVLNFLLHLYVSNFYDPLAQRDAGEFSRTSTLYAGCNSLLWTLSTAHGGLAFMCEHPFHVLWSTRPALPFTTLVHDRTVRRARIWTSTNKEFIVWRVRSIMEMMLDWRRPYEEELLMDITADVLEFAGSRDLEFDLSIRALRSLHQVITRGEISVQRAICQYRALNTHEHFVALISRIITRISYLVNADTPEWDIFTSFRDQPHFDLLDEAFFKSNAVLRIIALFIEAARSDDDFLGVILEANIFGLLRPLLQQEFGATNQLAPHYGANLLKYDPADIEFLARIQAHGLDGLYPIAPENVLFVDPRRIILSWAFEVVFRREEDPKKRDPGAFLKHIRTTDVGGESE